MTQERFDIVLKVLSGPMAGSAEVVLRGPVVRIGASPGPGGFKLSGYRGLDARQAVITAYDGGAVAVAPVGTNQVRMAPHPNVQWKEIDPLARPEYLSEGCALHLGPVGRGATLQFMRAQALGQWTAGQLASEVGSVDSLKVGSGPTTTAGGQHVPTVASAVPDAYQVGQRTRRIAAATMPLWFLGCSSVMVFSVVAMLAVLVIVKPRDIPDMEPKEGGKDYYLSVEVNSERLQSLDPKIKTGMQKAFLRWVMTPNAQAAGKAKLQEFESWDMGLYERTNMMVLTHSESKTFFRRLETVRKDYAFVVQEIRKAGLPEVFAGIPYGESRYDAMAQSAVCAKGYWQFMPEMALRMQKKHGLDFRVEDCAFRGVDALWSPTMLAPPFTKNMDYVFEGACRIPPTNGCKVDDRTDLKKSTAAAIEALKEPWEDPVLRKSGAAVQIAIASHNAGYDDSRFGIKKRTNLLPAYERYAGDTPESEWHRFLGDMIRCPSRLAEENPEGSEYCTSLLPAEAQHYVYPILSIHILAACFYGKNYGSIDAFKPYKALLNDGYCSGFPVPDAGL